ncbi:MAG: hypothetical protein JW757_05320 [Anaerolineales bacterium]|nr:hypothetical protein [Anaerolineales bacterium]
MTPTTPSQASQGLKDLIERAEQDLASRLSIDATEISVVEAREVVWSNSSLGCPQPGMAYADVLTPGYLIVLQAKNFNFEYHASTGTELIFCQNPEPPASGTPIDL